MAINVARFSAEVLDLAQHAQSVSELRQGFLRSLRAEVGCDGALFRPGDRWIGSEAHYLDEGPRFTDAYVRHADHYGPELQRWCSLSRGSEAFIDNDVHPVTQQSKMSIYADVLHPEGIRSILACPVIFRGQTIGLSFLIRRGHASRFEPELAGEVTRLATVIALAECAVRAAEDMKVAAPQPLVKREDEGDDLALQRFRMAFVALGPRQQQVALLIARGLQSKEIAALLRTSPNTVRCQTQQIFERLETHGRARLTHLVHRAGLAVDDGAQRAAPRAATPARSSSGGR